MYYSIRDITNDELSGRTNVYRFRKIPNLANTANMFFDLSSVPGNPAPKYWYGTPLKATVVTQSDDGGFFHGADVTPYKKYLRKVLCQVNGAAINASFHLCDYLMYYPLVDEGSTDEQFCDNTVGLTRYADGKGVQMVAISVAGRTGGAQFFVKYTNQDGVTGRVTPIVQENTTSVNGSVVTHMPTGAANNAFTIPLQSGDTGVRAIESVTMVTTDVGLFSILLIKPLASFIGPQDLFSPVEVDFLTMSNTMTEIKPNAYLNAFIQPVASIASTTMTFAITTQWTS